MKLETMLITSLVAVGAFIICLTLMGDSIINSEYYVPQEVANYSGEFPKTIELQGQLARMANLSYEKAAKPATGNILTDASNLLTAGWQQTIAAFEIGRTVISIPFTTQGSLTEVGGFLRINGMYLVLFSAFLTVAGAFAVAAYWRGRRA